MLSEEQGRCAHVDIVCLQAAAGHSEVLRLGAAQEKRLKAVLAEGRFQVASRCTSKAGASEHSDSACMHTGAELEYASNDRDSMHTLCAY